MDEMYKQILNNAQQSQIPSGIDTNPLGLSALIASNPNLDEEDIEVITALQSQSNPAREGLASMYAPSIPQRSKFNITPEMQQLAMAIDYFSNAPAGTSMKQIMDQYNFIASQEDKTIGDYRAERAYQDARADKAKAEEKAERAYRDTKEKERRDYIDKRLEGLQGPAFRANTETAKTNVANEARNLDPERFAGKSDDEIIEDLKLGVEPQKKSGKDYDKETELIKLEYKLKKELAEINNKAKADKDAGKMGDAEKERMKGEVANIKKEGDKLQEENRKVQEFNASYVKNAKKINSFDAEEAELDDLVKDAADLIGVGIRPRGKNNPKAVAAYQRIKNLITNLNTSMIEFAKEAGATGKMLDTKDEKELFLGSMANLNKDLGGWGTTEKNVKAAIREAIIRYKQKMQEYKNLLSERNKNYEDNKNRFDVMQSDFDTKYGLNKNKPVKNGTTKTAAGFKITIK